MFWGIFAAGILGGATAIKNTILGNWIFLTSCIFSAYLSILATPEISSYLKDFKEIPENLKGGGITVLLFILLMILCHKIFHSVTGEEEYLDNLPEKLEKSFNFVCGFFSGTILAVLLIFCIFAIIPDVVSGDTLERKQTRTAMARKYASHIVTAGNIFSFSYLRGEKQQKVLEKIVPVPVEKKVDKVSAGKNLPEKKSVKENRKNIRKNNTSPEHDPRKKQGRK